MLLLGVFTFWGYFLREKKRRQKEKRKLLCVEAGCHIALARSPTKKSLFDLYEQKRQKLKSIFY